jgi:NADP-dependent 3-hydroxy acid dehydrogenase YdfG
MTVFQSQKTALITGAASGIGFATAKLCRSRGMHLALLDIDGGNLHKARDELAVLNPLLKTESYEIDVGDRNRWNEVTNEVKSAFSQLDLVFLNAARGQRAQSKYEGRLKPWADIESWKKVCSLGPLFHYRVCLIRTDARHQCLRAPEWHRGRYSFAPIAQHT